MRLLPHKHEFKARWRYVGGSKHTRARMTGFACTRCSKRVDARHEAIARTSDSVVLRAFALVAWGLSLAIAIVGMAMIFRYN